MGVARAGASMGMRILRRQSKVLATLTFLLSVCGLITLSSVPWLPDGPGEIPPKMWQIYIDNFSIDGNLQTQIGSWMSLNADHQYSVVNKESATPYIRQHYSQQPQILETFRELRTTVLLVDYMRYLLLYSEGGIYSDLDTTNLQPVDVWVPPELQAATKAIVGVEYDQRDDEDRWPGLFHRIQFCQWTIASAARHPMLRLAVDRTTTALQALAAQHNTTMSTLQPTDTEVVMTTGPVIWTGVVFDSLSAAMGERIGPENITGLSSPRLFGDILVLPINAFGTGQPHSGSVLDGAPDALVRHGFRGSWKHGWRK